MSARIRLAAVAASLVFASGLSAQTTIDFNTQDCIGNPIVTDVVDQGFTFSSDHFHVLCALPAITNGTVTIGHEGAGLGLPIHMTRGSAFSMQAFDGAQLFASPDAAYPDATHIDVVGTYSGGGTVTSTFSLVTGTFTTYTFGAEWTDLVSVAFNGYVVGGSANAGYQLDNIVVDGVRTVVPEPGTYAMLALGLSGLAAANRRRRVSGAN